jgi:hypothetical protein
MSLSTYAFCHGDRGAIGRSRMPMARRRRTKTGPYEASRSLMRYRGAWSHGNASVIWREIHSAVGFAVTPNDIQSRRPCELVRPYILRRMKTDKSIIADLPDKTEIKALCGLSRRQTALYGQAVEDLARSLDGSEGIQRKGIVLAMLMRLKQICNHPSQWLNDNAWAEQDSGKWTRLREIADVVAARQEKMLVFTQFREIDTLTGLYTEITKRRE